MGRKVLSEGVAPPTLELLRILGSGVSILPPSKLSDLSEETLRGDMSSLSQASWNPAQAKILAKKLLEKVKVRSDYEMVLSLEPEEYKKGVLWCRRT